MGKNGLSIMAGFRKSSAYPLNLGVKKDRQVAPSLIGNPFGSRESVTDVKSSPGLENSYSPDSEVSNFSSSQEVLFCKRYKEGYDLPDPEYRQWLATSEIIITSFVTKLKGKEEEKAQEAEEKRGTREEKERKNVAKI